MYHTCEGIFRPLAFELLFKEICPYLTRLSLPPTVSMNFWLIWQFCLLLTACFGFQLWPGIHCSSHFKSQKWNRVVVPTASPVCVLSGRKQTPTYCKYRERANGFKYRSQLASTLTYTSGVFLPTITSHLFRAHSASFFFKYSMTSIKINSYLTIILRW